MADEKIDKARWQTFFDRLSQKLKDQPVAVEMVGLDLGDQIEDEALALAGITYEPADDVLYLYMHKAGHVTHTTHSLASPTDIYTQADDSGVRRIVVFDQERHEILVHLREPIAVLDERGGAEEKAQKSPVQPEPRR